MSWMIGIAAIIYVTLTSYAYVRFGILRALWKSSFCEILPVVLVEFWSAYPARRWPGALKLIGLPLTFVFLLLVAISFVLAHLLMLIAFSPHAVWRLIHQLIGRGPRKPKPPSPPAVATQMRAAG